MMNTAAQNRSPALAAAPARSSILALAVFVLGIAGSPVLAQWSLGPFPPGGASVTTVGTSCADPGGVTLTFSGLVPSPCVQRYWGRAGVPTTASLNTAVAAGFTPTAATSASAVFSAATSFDSGPSITTVPMRLTMTSLSAGAVVVASPPGSPLPGEPLVAIPAGLTSFSVNLLFEVQSPFTSAWVPLNTLTPLPGYPASGSCASSVTDQFYWWSGGPCATVQSLAAHCGPSTMSGSAPALGSVGVVTVNSPAHGAPVYVLLSLGIPTPTPYGACTIYIDLVNPVIAGSGITSLVGTYALPIPIPFIPAAAGFVLTEQSAVFYPTSPTGLGADVTNGLRLTLGY